MSDPSQDEVGARYGVPKETGKDAVSHCRAWFTDPEDAAAYALSVGGEVWDLVEGRRIGAPVPAAEPCNRCGQSDGGHHLGCGR